MSTISGSSTSYNGFKVIYPKTEEKKDRKLNYYQKAKLDILSTPFKNDRDKNLFSKSLANWGDYRRQQGESFKKYYRVESVSLNEVFNSAIGQYEVRNADNNKVAIVLSSHTIDQFETDAVVNAANESLLGGGGCDFQIHSGAGPILVRECATTNGCKVGEAVLTKGYDLPAHYVIHTVGPLLTEEGRPNSEALAKCYRSCLKICEEMKFESVVFSCISCGFYNFPIDIAARVVKKEVTNYTARYGHHIKTIIFALNSDSSQHAYLNAFNENKPV